MQNSHSFIDLEQDSLILDIGSGTQDVLYARAHTNLENWTRFILPSPATLVAQKIAFCTITKTPICLMGTNMGGGFYYAIKAHLNAGLPVLSTEKAALSLCDDIDKVKTLGIQLVSEAEILENISYEEEDQYNKARSKNIPYGINVNNQTQLEKLQISETTGVIAEFNGHQIIELQDFSFLFWNYYLAPLGLSVPKNILIAAQDHGVHLNTSNRIGRFQLWKDLLKTSQNPCDWIFNDIPTPYTRLHAIRQTSKASYVADTGTAALLGALSMPEVRDRSEREGVTIVNLGNSHVLAFLLYQSKVYGIYEHHTSMHTAESLQKDLQEFRLGWLPDEEVREHGGHGCIFHEIPAEAEGFRPIYILGPRRNLLEGYGQFIAPYGDMMMAGSYGLLYAFLQKNIF